MNPFDGLGPEAAALLDEIVRQGYCRISIVDMPKLRDLRVMPPVIWMGQIQVTKHGGKDVTAVCWPGGPEHFSFLDNSQLQPGLPDIIVKLSDRGRQLLTERGVACAPFKYGPGGDDPRLAAAVERIQNAAPKEAFFTMLDDGVTLFDEPALRKLAATSAPGAMQPFFAAAIIQLMDKGQRGELATRSPGDVNVIMTQHPPGRA